MRVAIIGAGTFGASLAWRLARAGEDVVLVDQFAPGDARATSGGETRLIRASHGPDADYTASARGARTLWRELEAETGADLMVECGMAWFAHREGGWETASERTLAAQRIPVERLDPDAAAQRFPSLGTDDLEFVLWEPEAGVLRAQRAVRALAEAAVAHGAQVVRSRARPEGGVARLADGTALEGDAVVWACGGWLRDLFPAHVRLRVTCQELLFLRGGPEWAAPAVPGWVDYDRAMYGTGDVDGIGAKMALDLEGPPLDPDAPLPAGGDTEPAVREYVAQRFPALAEAPLAEVRTCRYELSADSHFIAAPHPEQPGVWLLGGGSGHGFKHGPAMAEGVIAALRGEQPLPARFAAGERLAGLSMRTAGSNRA
jgi:glycine/D-amino acid oxidase-like deaminating enzyme